MTAQFLSSLDVRDIDDGRWELIAPFLVFANDKIYRVPSGFITDFASVPRIPLAFWLFGNLGHRAAVVHDWLYSSKEVPRDEADSVLCELLKITVSSARANAMWAAVRLFGGRNYERTDP